MVFYTRANGATLPSDASMTSGLARTAKIDFAHRRAAGWLALVLASVPVAPVPAAEVSLYRATVPLKGTTEADRNAAFGEALRVVAVRASGRRDAGSNAGISASADRANRLVQQYSATPDGELKVGFDAATIDEVLEKAGLPAWPSERPSTLVIMAVSGVGGGVHVVRSGESSAERTQLELAAQARGVPLVWPVAEASIEALRAQLESSGVEGATRAAGAHADAVLIGSVAGGQTEWTLVHAGESLHRRGSIADGAHLAADSYAEIYAPPSTRGLSTVDVRIDGVESLAAYVGLMNELESLSMVRGIAVHEVDRATVRLGLTLRGDLALLRRVALLTPKLRPASGTDASAPQFVYLQ